MQYQVCHDIHFSYGHRLLGHPGKCAHIHGHNGSARIEISSDQLDQNQMVVDFDRIKQTIGRWIRDHIDHKLFLEKKDPLVNPLQKMGEPVVIFNESPTAEVIARLIYKQSRQLGLPVSKVTLWETPHSMAAYSE